MIFFSSEEYPPKVIGVKKTKRSEFTTFFLISSPSSPFTPVHIPGVVSQAFETTSTTDYFNLIHNE